MSNDTTTTASACSTAESTSQVGTPCASAQGALLERRRRPVFILHGPDSDSLQVMRYVFRELCVGFQLLGHAVHEVSSISDITNDGIVFMGNGRHHPRLAELLAAHAPDAIYIGWYWHDIDHAPLKRFIMTHEDFLNPAADEDARRWSIILSFQPRCPLLLRASEPVSRIGTYPRSAVHDYCYMGCKYLPDWVPRPPFRGLYITGGWDEYWPYDRRRKAYLASTFALGFQRPGAETVQHVSQRIYEGLAYGCIVLTNSTAARDQTEGIAQLVTSREDLETKMRHYLAHPEEAAALRERGYEFVRRAGTCELAVARYIACIRDAFGIEA